MPTVPKVEKTVKTRSGAAPTLRGKANFSAPKTIIPDTSNAFAKTQKAFADLAAESKVKADEAALLEASNSLDNWEIGALFDPKKGALNTKGKSAFGLSKDILTDYQKFTGELRLKLGNEDQKSAFDRLASKRRVSTQKSLLRHERQQMDVYQDAQSLANVQSNQQRAFLHYNDPQEVGNALTSMQDTIRSQGALKGVPQEVTKNAITVETSNLLRGTILAALVSEKPVDILQAKGLFDDFKEKGDLLPKDILDLDAKFDKVMPEAAANVEFGSLFGGETRSELETIAAELDGQTKGAGDEFLALTSSRDHSDFYAQVDQPGGAALALHDLENDKYGGVSKAEKREMKKNAINAFEKEGEDERIQQSATQSIKHEELAQKSLDQTLTNTEVENFKANNKNDPKALNYAEILQRNLSEPERAKQIASDQKKKTAQTKRKEEAAKVQATTAYLGLWERFRNFGFEINESGKLEGKVSTEATMSELLEFQRDVVIAQGDGQLTPSQSAGFQKMTPMIRKRIDRFIKSAPGFFEDDFITDDLYTEAYDQVVSFIEDNPSLDTEDVRKGLFTDIFTVADLVGAQDIEDIDEREAKLAAVGSKVVNRFIRTQFPEFSSVSDENMPGSVFKADGRTINLPANSAKVKTDAKVTPSEPLRASYTAKNGVTVSLEDIQETAKNRNMTPQEVVRQMRNQGHIE